METTLKKYFTQNVILLNYLLLTITIIIINYYSLLLTITYLKSHFLLIDNFLGISRLFSVVVSYILSL